MRSVSLLLVGCLLLAGCFGGDAPEVVTDENPPALVVLPSGDVLITMNNETRTTPPADAALAQDAAMSASGRWLPPFEGEIPAVSLALLPDRRVLYWNGLEDPGSGFTDLPGVNAPAISASSRILDLGSGHIVEPAYFYNQEHDDLFCSGFTMLPDGRILQAGGTSWPYQSDPGATTDGIAAAHVFNPANNTWTSVSDLVLNRWYPTIFPTPDGGAAIASGIGTLVNPSTHWANFEYYAVDSDEWSIMPGTQEHNLPLYPNIRVLPGGDLAGHAFFPTSGTSWGPFGAHPEQAGWSSFQSYDLDDHTWYDHGMSEYGFRGYASTLLLPGDPANDYAPTILSFGGTSYQSTIATPLTEIIDASTNPPTTRAAGMLNSPRWHHQSVILPDGKPLTIGGGLIDSVVPYGPNNVPVMAAEMFDVASESWIALPEMQVERMYHSTAIVLPDGRVLVGGHVPNVAVTELERETVRQPIEETRFEIYEPGYLFRGERPVIASAPLQIDYRETFFLETNTTNIDSVMLMKPGTTTHAFDSNARATYLEIVEPVAGGVMVKSPPSSVVSQPGPHMLFLNGAHADGPIPSVAAMVWLGVEPSVDTTEL